MRSIYLVFALFMTFQILGQQNSNVYSLKFKVIKDSMHIENIELLTHFNTDGYNNQPRFFNKNEVYLTVGGMDGEQTDIYKMDLNKTILNRVTATQESEYSPTLMPDKKKFSVIRVQNDKTNSQVLWQYPLDRSNGGQMIIKDLVNVGYHQWIDQNSVALFLVGDPNTLIIRDIQTNEEIRINSSIGRSMHLYNGKLYYIYKISDQFWHLKYYDPQLKRSIMLLQSLPGKEDFAVSEKGEFFMGKDSELYIFRNQIDQNWKKITDLSAFGIKNIRRIHILGNQMVLVDETPARE